MDKIKFLSDKKVYDCSFFQIGPNQIRLVFRDGVPVNTNTLLSGFVLVNEHNPSLIQTDRKDYKFLYRVYEDNPNKMELCNDNIPWVAPPEPEPIPEPEPRIPTLEEVQEAKVAEMNATQQMIIANGVPVELSDGTSEHFTLTANDQISLFGLKDELNDGAEKLPWHVSDESKHCDYYSPEDMKIITSAAKKFVTYHVTYFRDLRIYIRSLRTKEEVEAIEYGVMIPEKYQSEPLKDMLAAQNK